jgi:hypothetical protein
MGGRLSAGVVGAYLLVAVLIFVLVAPRSGGRYVWVPYFLSGATILFLAKYLSTRYTIRDAVLVAGQLGGRREVRLQDVRAIEYVSLRDLSPFGGFHILGEWGWRGPRFSRSIGAFDAIYSEANAGLLVTGGANPLYISPREPQRFARELSRRVRSAVGPLSKEAGPPGP